MHNATATLTMLCGALLLCLSGPAVAQDAGADPGASYFALDHVLDVDIRMPPADWESLRHQTRTLEDAFGGTDCLAQPFASVFSWFPAEVTVDGVRYADVGVRKKGFLGSLNTDKPALKVRFDKFVDDQRLGGVLERITLNNVVQDPSMINTCLAYGVFADAGLPAPRCNFATVAVNGDELGLYVHVEDIRTSLLERSFADAGGNLYEGTVSDFRPELRGTFEKKTNEDAGDWSDVDAVIAALQDPSPAGLQALDAAVDRDRFLTFWAAEVLVGHWDGYSGNRNNFYFYGEPDGRLTFIPWGADSVFDTTDNPFDDFVSPLSVMASGAIAHRLYRDEAARSAYAARLRELLDTVWNEAELLRRTDRMAAIVQTHALAERRVEAARDTNRVRRFIRARRAEIVAELEPEPPDWPWPPGTADVCMGETSSFEVSFETSWGSKDAVDPFAEGSIERYVLDDVVQEVEHAGATAGLANAEEAAEVGLSPAAFLTAMKLSPDFSFIEGVTVWLSPDRVADDARLVFGTEGVGGVLWSMPADAAEPEEFIPITEGWLELDAADTTPGAPISARIHGTVRGPIEPSADAEQATADTDAGALVINEVAARGEPLDWFEIHNRSDTPLSLAGFVLADDLTDRGKRTPFPPLIIAPGAYLQIQLDSDGWPGFALGSDEELGIWAADGSLVAQVDWARGQSGTGASFARVPDVTGPFQTVSTPTPGAPNRAP